MHGGAEILVMVEGVDGEIYVKIKTCFVQDRMFDGNVSRTWVRFNRYSEKVLGSCVERKMESARLSNHMVVENEKDGKGYLCYWRE